MSISNSFKDGVPIRLIRNEQIVVETRGDAHWNYDDVTDHYALACSFIDYLDSVRADLVKTKKRKIKHNITEDFDFVEIQYKDRTLRYAKDEVVIPTPIAVSA